METRTIPAPPVAAGLFTVLLFVGVALFRFDVVTSVSHRFVPVVSVGQVPGDMAERLVIVDLGERTWPIRTADRLLRVEPGGTTCLVERRYVLRRFVRRRIALPGFCRASLENRGAAD